MKKTAIISSTETPLLNAVITALSGENIKYFKTEPESGLKDFDLIVLLDDTDKISSDALCCHYSLLPAFEGDNPVEQAFMAGAKVTGITIYYKKSKRILAQYPYFIPNSAHFDEVKQELKYLEQVIFPIVIKKILSDEPVESKNIIGKCGGCSGCKN